MSYEMTAHRMDVIHRWEYGGGGGNLSESLSFVSYGLFIRLELYTRLAHAQAVQLGPVKLFETLILILISGICLQTQLQFYPTKYLLHCQIYNYCK